MFSGTGFTLRLFVFLLSLEVLPFSSLCMLWKGRWWCFCRRRVPLVPAMQPVMNSSPFVPRLCFLTASRCEERCHDTNHYVSSPCLIWQTHYLCIFYVGFFVLSFSFMQKSLYLFCMTKCSAIASLQRIGTAFFCGEMGCVFNNLDRTSAPEAWRTDFSAPSRSS